MITLTPGAAPAAVESIANDQVMEEFTNLRDHIISQAKATADDVKRNHDEELKDFKEDIDRKLKVLGVLKVEGLYNIVCTNLDHIIWTIFYCCLEIVNTLIRSL